MGKYKLSICTRESLQTHTHFRKAWTSTWYSLFRTLTILFSAGSVKETCLFESISTSICPNTYTWFSSRMSERLEGGEPLFKMYYTSAEEQYKRNRTFSK